MYTTAPTILSILLKISKIYGIMGPLTWLLISLCETELMFLVGY